MAREHDRAHAGAVPFWAHQLAEMLLGGLLLVEGARTGQHTAVLVGMGGALLLLALMSDGALGVWPWIGRRLHRVLDLVAAVALAISPLVLSLEAALAIVILEAAALGMAWLAIRTNWTNWSVRTRRPAQARRPAPAPPEAPPSTPGDRPAAPPLARTLGATVGRVRDDGPRQLGRLAGRLRRAARQATKPPRDAEPGEPPAPDHE